MRTRLSVILAGMMAFCIGCGGKSEEEGSGGSGTVSDRSRLQGTWLIQEIDAGGGFRPDKGITLTITDDTAVLRGTPDDGTWKMSLESGKDPKRMTLTRQESKGSTQPSPRDDVPKGYARPNDPFRAIYKLDGNTLTLALTVGSGVREWPTTFAHRSRTDDAGEVVVFRFKKKEEPKPVVTEGGGTATGSGSGKSEPDITKAQGNWKISKLEMIGPDGQTPPPEFAAQFSQVEITVKGNMLIATMPTEKDPGYAVFTTDPTKSPKQIDFVATESDGVVDPAERKQLGIYKWEGTTLVVAVAVKRDSLRPTSFTATPAGVIVLRLQKR